MKVSQLIDYLIANLPPDGVLIGQILKSDGMCPLVPIDQDSFKKVPGNNDLVVVQLKEVELIKNVQ